MMENAAYMEPRMGRPNGPAAGETLNRLGEAIEMTAKAVLALEQRLTPLLRTEHDRPLMAAEKNPEPPTALAAMGARVRDIESHLNRIVATLEL